ncbi:hypothetical protein D1007_17162 [Hordeum vulgare]|nr:hypothetical protein D1007_17162 [Hordeum vulgare]
MGAEGGSSAAASRCRSTGATMSVAPASDGNGASCCCCCINIYVNNNVQGVTNSVLFGSSVVMRDPGARVVPSRRPPRSARVCRGKQRRQQKKKKMMRTTVWAAAMVCLAALAVILLLLSVKRT